jgi:plastocyanin
MANFPNPPHTVGDTHQIGDKIWTWDGEKWFADYNALVPVFQAKNDEGMVDKDPGSDFELGLDADILSELYNPTVDVIGNVIVTGDNNPTVGDIRNYSFTIDGNVSDEVGSYSCTVPDAIVQLNQIQFPTVGTGKVIVEVTSATATDSPVTAEMDITVSPVGVTIGTVTINGDFSPDQGDVVTYSYSVDGDAPDHVGVLTALGAGASVSGDTVTWTGSGAGEVRYDVTSLTATDSPRHNTENVNVTYKDNIGNITLNGNSSPVVGTTEVYTATFDGTVQSVNAQWTIDPALGATQNPIIPNSFDFTGANVGATGDITVTYTSLAAWDSPKSESITVTVASAAPPPAPPKPITGPSSVDLTTGTSVNDPVVSTYEIGSGTSDEIWTYESDIPSVIPIFSHYADATYTTISNTFAMFDGDTTRPTSFDWQNKPDINIVSITFDKDVFPEGEHNFEVLIQETTGEEIGLTFNQSQDAYFTYVPRAVCTSPTWLSSNRAVNWKEHFQKLLIDNVTANAFVQIYAIRVNNQIIRFNRPPQVNGYGDRGFAFYRFFGPANYKVKADFKHDGHDYNEVLDVAATGHAPLEPVTPRTTAAPASSTNFTVTVTNTGYGNKYVIDGVQQDSLTLTAGNTYIFNQTDSSNSGHPLRIYTDSSKSTEVTDGVTIGSDTTTFVPATTGTYSYQCSAHANMGGDITVQ